MTSDLKTGNHTVRLSPLGWNNSLETWAQLSLTTTEHLTCVWENRIRPLFIVLEIWLPWLKTNDKVISASQPNLKAHKGSSPSCYAVSHSVHWISSKGKLKYLWKNFYSLKLSTWTPNNWMAFYSTQLKRVHRQQLI